MTRQRRRFWLWASAALLAGLLLRLWFVVHLSDVSGDAILYGDIAKNWLLHGTYGFSELTPAGQPMLRPTLIRLPGYPLFLALCFRVFGVEQYRAVLYVQIAADLLTCWLAAATAGRIFARRAFLPVLWIAALCPFTANYVASPLTETLVLTAIALTFYGFARWQQAGAAYNRWLWLTAAALSYSILLRPEQGLLAAAVVPAMLWAALATPERRASLVRSAAPVLIASICALLPLVPWTARNWHTFHVFQPLAPRTAADPDEQVYEGFNHWYRTWGIDFASTDQAYWNYGGSPIRIQDLPTRAFTLACTADSDVPLESQPLYAQTVTLLSDYNQDPASSPAIDARFEHLARQRIQASPLCYHVALPVARVFNMLLRPRVEKMSIPDDWWKPPTPLRQTVFAAICAALNVAYLLLALAGLRAWRRRNWAGSRELAFALIASVILRMALLLTLDNSEPRYTLELFPVLFVCAGALFAQSGRHSNKF